MNEQDLNQLNTLGQVCAALAKYYENADETEQIIITAAVTAAAADAAASFVPGLAVSATIISCFGTVWGMYGVLCKKLGITLKENALKIIARAALADISESLGSYLVAMVVSMFVPGASILASAIVTFITIYLAGYIFLRMILSLAKKYGPDNIDNISESELKKNANINLNKNHMNAAKSAFEANKNKIKNSRNNTKTKLKVLFLYCILYCSTSLSDLAKIGCSISY